MKKLLKKFLPKKAKKALLHYYTRAVKENHARNSEFFYNRVQPFELEAKHLQHMKAVTDRTRLLQLLPTEGVVAEIGVDQGNFSEEILAHNKPSKLHLVDLWGSERYHQGKRQSVETKFKDRIASGQVEMNLGLSTEVVQQFEDAYFDWVYIDTVHDYNVTYKEIELYSAKVKPTGIIAGHDYVAGNWKGLVKYGVIEAVHEFCYKYDWEFVYLTMETRAHRSFAIRRINR